MQKLLFIILTSVLFQSFAFSQSIKETDYGKWLIRFTNQIINDRHEGYSDDEIDWYFYNLDKMPIPNDTTDVGIYFTKFRSIITEYFPYDATMNEMGLFRLLINASPTRLSGDNEFTRSGFLSFYEFLLDRYEPFQYSNTEKKFLIEAITLAPKPMKNVKAFSTLLEQKMEGYTYEGIRTHLTFLLEDQNISMSKRRLSGRGIRITVGELEELRRKINTRFNEDAVQMIDQWLWEERKRD